MPKIINNLEYFSASEVAVKIGVHRLTLLRWIREEKIPEVKRDRNGWRIFSHEDVATILQYAHSVNVGHPQLNIFERKTS